MRKPLRLAAIVSAVVVLSGGTYSSQTAEQAPTARVLSTQAEYVSGGNALVRIALPGGLSWRDVSVTLNQKDIGAMFRPVPEGNGLIGVVTGMIDGRNSIAVSASWRASSELVVTNYPITGPILSGPHITPFICQTESFNGLHECTEPFPRDLFNCRFSEANYLRINFLIHWPILIRASGPAWNSHRLP